MLHSTARLVKHWPLLKLDNDFYDNFILGFVQAYPLTTRDLAQASPWTLRTILSITFIMPVQQTILFEERTFFITFTVNKWMNLVETTL
jgi:hypothetical protein